MDCIPYNCFASHCSLLSEMCNPTNVMCLQATFDCLLKTYGFLTPDLWTETRFTKSPYQEYTDLLAKSTKAITYVEDVPAEIWVLFFCTLKIWTWCLLGYFHIYCWLSKILSSFESCTFNVILVAF